MIHLGGSDHILSGPRSIQEDWASLKQAGFTLVDAALPVPDNPNEAFIFFGERYVHINVQQGACTLYPSSCLVY
jgi:hypothetical protein